MIRQLPALLWNKQLYVIFKDGEKRGEYMDSLFSPTTTVLRLASWSTYNTVDSVWIPTTAL